MIFWNTLIRFERSKVIPFIAARNAFGVALPLAIGAAIGQTAGGVVAAIGALNVSYSDSQEPYRERARRMLAATACNAGAVMAGGLLGPAHVVLVALVGLCGFLVGMLGAVSQAAADIGVMTLATLIVFAAQSITPSHAVELGLLAIGGGLFQTGLAVASWTVRRYSPERRALANLYAAIARAAASGAEAFSPEHAPPATSESTEAQRQLAALNGDSSIEGERYLALLSQAERMRLALTAIARLRIRISREPDGAEEAAILDDAMAAASRALDSFGNVLLPGAVSAMSSAGATEASRIAADAERLRVSGRAMARDARRQLDGLAGQIRAAAELSFRTTPAGEVVARAAQAAAPPPLRLGNALARMRANLNFRSDVFRHAVRMAVCVAAAEGINRVVAGANRGYWLPMTAAIVLRPDFTATFTRGFLRLGGTLAGLMAATAIVHYLNPSLGAEVAVIVFFVYLLRCFGPANYGIFVTCLTALIVFMISITGVAAGPVMVARGMNTLAGGGMALLTYALWPTWERNVAPERLAALLDAYRAYFNAVCEVYLPTERADHTEVDRARFSARLARSNAEASMARLAAEPGDQAHTARLQRIMANSHRFVLAAMSMEAAFGSGPAPFRPAFGVFAGAVSATLERLAGALRGKPLDRLSLPDLRELHRELAGSGDPQFGRHALVNVEADRIANSLNTLTELIAAG